MQLPNSPVNAIKAEDVVQALRERYAAPEYAFLDQVRDATGYGGSRTADALVMGLWPSLGIHLHGFEVKVSRGDWRRELKEPEKAEAIGKFCHYFWIAAPAGIVPIDDLPSTWGLLELRGRRMQATKAAVFRDDAKPLTITQIAAIMRRASTTSPSEAAIHAAHQRGYDEGLKAAKESIRTTVELATNEAQRLKADIAQFETESGVRINNWHGGDLGRAVKRVLDGEGAVTRDLMTARQAAARFLDSTAGYLTANDVPRWYGDGKPGAVTRALEAELRAQETGA